MLSSGVRAAAPEPRWPAAIMVLAAVALHFTLPPSLRVGPPWVGAAIIVSLVLISAWASRTGRAHLNQQLGYVLAAALTFGLLVSVGRLITALTRHLETAAVMLRSAAVLWAANVIVFAVWYWRLDGGGPNARDRRGHAALGAFLFPQIAVARETPDDAAMREWRPHFIDYLFLSFNTSTAFSPTDVPVMSRWAKALTMVQATISFTTVVVLVARAINTL
jgi:hypothetical protein